MHRIPKHHLLHVLNVVDVHNETNLIFPLNPQENQFILINIFFIISLIKAA